jgi:glycosyltransferase involved in cell wall biosynthesis
VSQESAKLPTFSLIVPTIGRPTELRALFQSLVAQTFSDFEVIVVDQSSDQVTEQLVAEFATRLTIHYQKMQLRGASRARNLGLTLAIGTYVSFPDDDCEYLPNYLTEIEQRFREYSEIDGIATQIMYLTKFDPISGPIDKYNLFNRFCEPAMFMRRQALGSMRFHEQMGPGAGTKWGADEGAELVLTTMQHGLKWYYFHDLVVKHPNPTAEMTLKTFTRAIGYARGRGYVLRKFQYAFTFVAKSMLRSLLGMGWMCITCQFSRARYYGNVLCGQVLGYFLSGPS